MKYDLHIDGPIGYWITAGGVRYSLETITHEKLKARETSGAGGAGGTGGASGTGGAGGTGGASGAGGTDERNPEVHVRVCSPGGSLSDGLAICALFRDHGNVHVHIQGMTASAATVLAMGAKKISMSPESVMLVHNASYMIFEWEQANKEQLSEKQAEYEEMKKNLATLDSVMADLYATRSGGNRDEMAALMKEERWLSAQECLALGLIDAIDESDENDGAAHDGSASSTAGMSAQYSAENRLVRAFCAGYHLPDVSMASTPPSAAPQPKEAAESPDRKNFWAKLLGIFAETNEPSKTTSKKKEEMAEPDLKAVTAERDTLQGKVTELEKAQQAVTAERDTLQAKVSELEKAQQAQTTERDSLQAKVTELEAKVSELTAKASADGAVTIPVDPVNPPDDDDFATAVANARNVLQSMGDF
ncbi:MAG: ATP-dependent Clp protease proteolytic subunit [Selenomonas sp.]|nr:ATP-dependent Clp protease proteolytic subunit [Selenomonas sp.]